MSAAYNQMLFGTTALPHTVVIARGDRVRYFTIRPWTAAAMALFTLAAATGGLLAGASSVIGGTASSLVAGSDDGLAEAYESRIETLRSEVDRLTTRKFLDQQSVSSKIDTLLDQQAALTERYARLQPLLDRAQAAGLSSAHIPVPEPKPAFSHVDVPLDGGQALSFAATHEAATLERFDLVDKSGRGPETIGTLSRPASPDLLRQIGDAIDHAETSQISGLNVLAEDARTRSAAIASVLRSEGIRFETTKPGAIENEGGPYVPVPKDRVFDAELQDFAAALDVLQSVRDTSADLPLGAPVTSTTISSTFGVRSDPFLGRAAMHTGIDFVAQMGSSVTATAPGKIVFAGESGGYGQMVEVDHGNGLSTRYGHMSGISVSVGDKVNAGDVVGTVGSTGRSTGPHLHYEIRRSGEAIDPSRYLRAGRRIRMLG